MPTLSEWDMKGFSELPNIHQPLGLGSQERRLRSGRQAGEPEGRGRGGGAKGADPTCRGCGHGRGRGEKKKKDAEEEDE